MNMSPESRSEALIEALPYIQQYRGQTFVIKYGGSAMEDEQIVDKFRGLIAFHENTYLSV
jgi:acetylglutamate kinase